MSEKKEGKIIVPCGVYPEKHEYDTAAVFLKLGRDVEFIKPSGSKHLKNPDVIIDGVLWEMKSPTGNSRWTVENQLARAGKQSKHVIFDTRRTKLSDDFIQKEIEKSLVRRKSIRKLLLITKAKKVVVVK